MFVGLLRLIDSNNHFSLIVIKNTSINCGKKAKIENNQVTIICIRIKFPFISRELLMQEKVCCAL